MLSLRLHPEADSEAIAAAHYIKEEDPLQSELFKEALQTSIYWARTQPLIFRCFEEDFRKIKIGKFRYLLVFRVRGDEIQILAVAHTSRRPGYWKERAKTLKD